MIGKKAKRKDQTKVDSLIGQHSQVQGDINFSGRLHVDGTVKGNVMADSGEDSVITVSHRGTIEGEVRVPYVYLNGIVHGDVHASRHVEMAPNAKVEGNVYYSLIEMAMGAEVNGKLVHVSEQGRPPLSIGHQGLPAGDELPAD